MKVKLGDICMIKMGQSPDSSTYNGSGNGLPFFQGNADFGEVYPVTRSWCSTPIKIAQEGDILISVRAPIGALNISNCKCCIGRGLAALTVDKNVCTQGFLWHALSTKVNELTSKGTGSTFKAINKKVLVDTKISLPSLDEQRRIAAVLDKVSDLIAKRRQQLEKLDKLVKARFVEMFGDFKTNPMGWPIVPFCEIAKIDAKMTMDFDKYANYPHIGIENIEKTTGILRGYKTVAEDNVLSGKYIFTHKHILYSKLRPNLNKVAVPDFDGVCSSDAYPILPFEEKCNRIFLAHNMRSNFFLGYIVKLCWGTNLPRVNRKEILDFQTPLPPVERQNRFATFVGRTEKVKKCINRNLRRLEILKKSLMQRYFG